MDRRLDAGWLAFCKAWHRKLRTAILLNVVPLGSTYGDGNKGNCVRSRYIMTFAQPSSRTWWLVAGSIAAIILTLAALGTPLYFSIVPIVGCIWFLREPIGRFVVFAGGALFVFGGEAGISAPKALYFIVALFIIGLATFRAANLVRTDWGRPFRSALWGSGVIATAAAVAVLVGLMNGAGISSVVRDGMTYLLILGAVPIAIDTASVMSRQTARWAVVAITLTAGLSFCVSFLAARGVSSLSIQHIGLPSMMALSVGVSLGLVLGLGQRGIRWGWVGLAIALISLVLVTGSRAGLVLLVAIVGVAGTNAAGRVPWHKLVVGAGAIAVSVAGLLVFASGIVTSSAFFESRIQASLNTIQNGAGQDASGIIRARATEFALEAWRQVWLTGQGFGHSYPDPSNGGGVLEFQIDTPAIILAKFGFVGTALLLVGFAFVIKPAFGSLAGTVRIPEQAVASGAAAVWIATTYFGTPTEDKGFSLAILMAILVLATSARERFATGEGWAESNYLADSQMQAGPHVSGTGSANGP